MNDNDLELVAVPVAVSGDNDVTIPLAREGVDRRPARAPVVVQPPTDDHVTDVQWPPEEVSSD